MQQTHFNRILAFIEGSMERIFVNTNFPYVDVISVPNGESWTVERLAKHIASLYRSKNVHANKVLVWFDRENRKESCEEIRIAVCAELASAGVGEDSIIVCIPDKMTENIILADEILIRSEFGELEYTYAGDGSHGKSILKSLFSGRRISYKETFHGASLLKKTYISRASTKSETAKLFYDNFDLDCWWKR